MKKTLPLLVLFCTACMPSLETQEERRGYLQTEIDENLEKTMKCDETTLTYLDTQEEGMVSYDRYEVVGCDQKSEYLTMVRHRGDSITWGLGLVPTVSDYEKVVQNQLEKTARFDMNCQDIDMTILNQLIAPMRGQYRATIGVRGCGKSSSYNSLCGHVGYSNGGHQLSCQYEQTASSADSASPKDEK